MFNATSVAALAQAILAGYVGATLWRGARTPARRHLARALLWIAAYAVAYALAVLLRPGTSASDRSNLVGLLFAVASAWEALTYVSWLGRGARHDDPILQPRWARRGVVASAAGAIAIAIAESAAGRRPVAGTFGILVVIVVLFVAALVVAVQAQRRGVRGALTISVACAFPVIAAIGSHLSVLQVLPNSVYYVGRDICLLLYCFFLFLSYLDDGHEPMSIEDRLVAGMLTAVLVLGTVASRLMESFATSGRSPGDAAALVTGSAWRFLILVALSGVLVVALVPQLFRRSLFRPLARLTGALTDLERGTTAQLTVDHEDEIGRLTRSFNSMAGALSEGKHSLQDKVRELETKQTQIEDLNAELRRQVAARSRQLADVLAKASSASGSLEPGTIIDGRYRVEGRLGAGGMGVVYSAVRLTDDRSLAIKVMADGASHGARFAREAEIAAGLAHDNLVGVLDVGLHEGVAYLVMEKIDGGSLEDARDRFGNVEWAVPLLAQISQGLVVLHGRSILHRDLKPANVLLATNGSVTVAKIGDFGIARLNAVDVLAATAAVDAPTKAASGPTATGVVMGTLGYMAPELSRGPGSFGPPSDVFAFGVLAYELLTKAPPFAIPAVIEAMAGRSLPEPPPLPPELPLKLAELVRACVATDPAVRPTALALQCSFG